MERQTRRVKSRHLSSFVSLAPAAEENRWLLIRYRETCFGKARMWKVSGAADLLCPIWLWIFNVVVFKTDDGASTETLNTVSEWFNTGHNVAVSFTSESFSGMLTNFTCHLQILDGMHLTKQSRSLVASYCRESVYHHLIVEFDCDDNCVEENVKDTAQFYQKIDSSQDWLKIFKDKSTKETAQYEKCSPKEGPLISVNNSENPMIHSVNARGVQGLLQTIILGVLSSPVIKHRVFYFSRVCHGNNLLDLWINFISFW